MNRKMMMLAVAGILFCPSFLQAEGAIAPDAAASMDNVPLVSSPQGVRHLQAFSDGVDAFDMDEFFSSPGAPMFADPQVVEQINYFMTVGKPLLQEWLYRSTRFIPLMKAIFREKKLPEDLVYVAMIESGLRMNAVSRARAVGPWQFMTTTAKTYGLKMDAWVDERRDPVKSTRAAAAYLEDLYGYFGSWPLALASYNAGAGRIERALFHSPDNDLPSIYESRLLRRETRNYVPKLLAAVIIARNPERYGFAVKTKKSFRYEEVQVEGNTELSDVAAFVGCAYDAIRDLNPELQRGTTPPYADRYLLRLPVGAKKKYLAVKALLLRNPLLAKYQSDARNVAIDERREGYAVLRKRDSARMDSPAFSGIVRNRLVRSRKLRNAAPVLPAAAKGTFGYCRFLGLGERERSRCLV